MKSRVSDRPSRRASAAARRVSLGLAATLSVALATTTTVQAWSVSTSRVGMLAGLSGGVPRTPSIAGTDLGWVSKYGPYQIVMFGDTFSTPQGAVNTGRDDATAYFMTAGSNLNTVPPLTFFNWADVGPGLEMGGARTPVGAAQFGGMDPWYGLFIRGGAYAKCSTNADCNGLVCDKSMGLGNHLLGAVMPPALQKAPCWKAVSPLCPSVDNNANRGLCRDPKASLATFDNGFMFWDAVDGANRSEQGKILTVATVHEFGAAGLGNVYDTVPFVTNKFANATMRTTLGYSDYRPATDPNNSQEILWVWGRSTFWQKKNATPTTPVKNAPNELYLAATPKAYIDNIETNNLPTVPLMYYTGSGWSINQQDARPLVANGGWEDGVSGHMSITFVQGLNKWVMLYGGGTPTVWDDWFGGELANSLRAGFGNNLKNVDGTIKMRIANDPWGPWSAPKTVLDRDDASICAYVWSPAGDACNSTAANSAWFPAQNTHGALYGVSTVEDWSQWNGNQATIGWFVSTFNPYNVQQMKTVITGPF